MMETDRDNQAKASPGDFEDGNYTSDPAWTVASGMWTVETEVGFCPGSLKGEVRKRRRGKGKDEADKAQLLRHVRCQVQLGNEGNI